YRLGELRPTDMERAGSDEQDAAARGHGGGEARQLAVAAQCRRHLLARFGEGRRIRDDDVEAFVLGGEPAGLGKGFAAAKRAGPADPIELCRRCRQRERRLGTVDAEDGGGRGPRRLDRKTAGIAIEVKNTRASGQTGDEAPIVALVEKPAGLLAGEQVSAEE